MKNIFTISTFVLLMFNFNGVAQDKTWIGPNNGVWNEPLHWSPEGVPTGANDVIIPSGSTVLIEASGTAVANNVLLPSGSILNKTGDQALGASLITVEQGAVVNLSEGYINSAMDMHGTMNIIGSEFKALSATTQNIFGDLIFEDQAELELSNSDSLIIKPNGICTLEGDGALEIWAFTGYLKNEGLIQKVGGENDFSIGVFAENENGTINVESGTISVNQNGTFTNGVYNVSLGSSLIINASSSLSGTLTGQLDGPLVINDSMSAADDDLTTLNFSGSSHAEWAGGSLGGSGDLINESKIVISGDANSAVAISTVNLINNGQIDLTTNENMSISSGGSLHNTASGLINILSDNNFNAPFGGSIINEGLIKKSQATGITELIHLENNGGTVQLESGTIYLLGGGSFTGGTYNVFLDAELVSTLGTSITIEGTLIGELDGPFSLYSFVNIDEGTEAIFDFSGASRLDWVTGNILGGGTLRNKSILNSLATSINQFDLVRMWEI